VIARAFERTVYTIFNKHDIDLNLKSNQFAYRAGGSSACVNALLKVQHNILSELERPCNKAVRLFTMDFSKAFDNVKHNLLAEKLKKISHSAHMINWYISFLYGRKQRLIHNGTVCL